MESEEVTIKMGMNLASLKSGFREAREAGQEWAHEHGLHVEKAGRAGHHLLMEIQRMSPLMAEGIRAFFNPFVAGIMAVGLLMKNWETFNQAIEKAAAKEAEIYGRREESLTRVADKSNKAKEAFREWLEQLDSGKPGDAAAQKMQEALEKAHAETGGDKAAFLRRKEEIELEAQAAAEKEMAAQKSEAIAKAERIQLHERGLSIDELKGKIKDLLDEEKEAAKEGTVGSFGARFMEKMVSFIPGTKDLPKNALRDATKSVEAEEKKEKRQALQEQLALLEAEEQAELKSLDVTKSAAKTAAEEKVKAEKTASETRIQLREQERLDAEKAEKEAERLAEKERLRAFEQSKFDRDLSDARRKRKEEENAAFLPTLQAIAGSAAWNPGNAIMDRMQRQRDDFKIRAGMSYAGKFAEQAQDLERLEADAKRALFIEGPESDRFKEDKKRIDSLKAGLAAAGLQRPDDKLESIDKHIADLLDKASKDGLVVQPVNGA